MKRHLPLTRRVNWDSTKPCSATRCTVFSIAHRLALRQFHKLELEFAAMDLEPLPSQVVRKSRSQAVSCRCIILFHSCVCVCVCACVCTYKSYLHIHVDKLNQNEQKIKLDKHIGGDNNVLGRNPFSLGPRVPQPERTGEAAAGARGGRFAVRRREWSQQCLVRLLWRGFNSREIHFPVF